jgi:hypothetical protein
VEVNSIGDQPTSLSSLKYKKLIQAFLVLKLPSIPDNLEHWQVFDTENQILHFLQNEGEFLEAQINLLA